MTQYPSQTPLHLHFETRRDKPPVFRMTERLVAEAAARAGAVAAELLLTVGEDCDDLAALRTASVLVTSNDVMRDPRFPLHGLAAAAPELRWIHIIGAGIEPLLPLDWMPAGVVLTNNSGVHVEKAREFATMALLMLNCRLPAMVWHQRRRQWHPIFTATLAGKTAIVIGLGDMGSTVARAAKRLGLHVVGVRRQAKPHRSADETVSVRQLDEVLPRADFVVVAAPLTPATRHLIGSRQLAMMKPDASLLNIGRAGVVDYAALCARLGERALAGAIIDVFDPEPLPADSALWDTPNLIITPHCSSDDVDRYIPLTLDLVFDNVKRLVAGKPLRNRIKPQHGY